jgi:peptidoglycan/xylan/chitin deacetylase (PgdA/CDA1 family)
MLQQPVSRRGFLSAAGLGAATFLVPRYALGQSSPPRFSLTFDDTWHDPLWRGAIALLEDAGFPATFYIITNRIGHTWQREFFEEGDLHKLIALGHEIGAHTRSHTDLTTLSGAALASEVDGSVDDLEAILGIRPRTFSYPFGKWNETVVAAVRQAGMVVSRGTNTDLNTSTTYKFNLRAHSVYDSTPHTTITGWIDRAINESKWYIINIHRLDEPGGLSMVRFKQIIDYLKQRQVTVATIRQCASTYFGV